MKRNNEICITLLLDIIILTTLLITSVSASLENTGKFQLHPFPSLVDRFQHYQSLGLQSATKTVGNNPNVPNVGNFRLLHLPSLVNRFHNNLNKSTIRAPLSSLAVTFPQNNPPNAPASPSGPSSGKIGTSYKYNTSTSEYNLGKADTLNLQASAIIRAKNDFKKYLYAFPAPNPLNITGLSGSVSLKNTVSNLAQGLFTIWVNPDGCPENGAVFDTYDQIFHKYPKAIILFRYILKSSQPEIVSVPTEFTLPVELPANGWIFTVLDGGEPAQGGQVALTSDMVLHYNNTSSHLVNPPQIVPLDYEYCYGQKWGCQLQSPKTSGIEAFAYVQPITSYTYLWQLAGDVSAGSFTGSPYSNPPVGPWVANFDFYVYPDCAGMKKGPQGPDDYYRKIPANSTKLAEVQLSGNGNVTKHAEVRLNGNGTVTKLAELQLNGNGKVALQQPTVKQFSPMLLKPGNCLVCLAKFTAASGGATLESQIQVLLQNIKGASTGRVQEPILEEANEQYKELLREKDQYLTCEHCPRHSIE